MVINQPAKGLISSDTALRLSMPLKILPGQVFSIAGIAHPVVNMPVYPVDVNIV